MAAVAPLLGRSCRRVLASPRITLKQKKLKIKEMNLPALLLLYSLSTAAVPVFLLDCLQSDGKERFSFRFFFRTRSARSNPRMP